jgi:hypothetical protein
MISNCDQGDGDTLTIDQADNSQVQHFQMSIFYPFLMRVLLIELSSVLSLFLSLSLSLTPLSLSQSLPMFLLSAHLSVCLCGCASVS